MINVLYCGNSNVFDGIITSLLSIEKYYKGIINTYIFTMSATHLNDSFTAISDEQVIFIDNMLKDTNKKSKAVKMDITDLYNSEIGGSPNEQSKYTPYALLRLFADQDNMPSDKLLYLDIDVLFNDDIRKLYDIDLLDYEYAAARDHYGKKLLKRDYINSGVILFNMPKIRKTGLLKKARELINNRQLMFADQSAIYLSTTKKLILPQYFNDQKRLTKKTIIRHFSKTLKLTPYPRTINIKPWKVSDIHRVFHCYDFDDILYEYIYYKKLYEKNQKKQIDKGDQNELKKRNPNIFSK